ncbi:MAG: hypothetical protein ACFE75_04920 [Candidatus Hodarchaeota archaeon]
MGEIPDSNDKIVNELKKINKRLDSIHSWLAAFIVISVLFYLLLIGLSWFPS